ncbi:MAG: triose-phosphate isomerase [Candidatus Nanohaloarchaea archaeon]
MIIVNFKAYEQAQGPNAVEIAEDCISAMERTGEKVIACPSFQDMLRLEDHDIEVFSQHLDPVDPGSHTGSVLAEGLRKSGASGTLINHSERRMEEERIRQAIERADSNGLTTVVCAQTPEECGRLSQFHPDYIAFEPPELIGSQTAVSKAKPKLIEEAVESSEVPTLTGAGIKDRKDVEKSVDLGCEGVLVASGVVKADDVEQEVKQLCRGL